MDLLRFQWLEELPQLPRAVRMIIVISMHVLLFAAAYIGGFLIRFDFTIPEAWGPVIQSTFLIVILTKVAVFGLLRNFNGWWKYVSLYDILDLARSLAIAEGAFLVYMVFIADQPFPRSIYILDYGLSLFLIAAARGSLRLVREAVRARAGMMDSGGKQNVLILGAGDTGETLLREITKNRNLPFKPIGFLDDDAYKRGLRIHGIPVLGPIGILDDAVQKHRVDQIIIAMPSADRETMRRVFDACRLTGVRTRILPAVETILEGKISLNNLREISIDDLLGRDPVRLDTTSIGRFLQGQTVLVTGAGGSIGSEICRQILRFNPKQLIMVERGETPLFFIHRELSQEYPDMLVPCIADVSDPDRMRKIFEDYRPEVVLHAAAYKHVPLMEAHPSLAVRNNVGGTRVMADLSAEFGVSNFILISTDKAVNPTSVMGATKRVTELYVLSLNSDCETHFCAVRFGNVLGSNGSVVPIFRDQIRRGGPVTVTHPEMTRYFMTIPEASQLVLQAAAFGKGGELFILDMGQPVKIADLARDMIRLSGLSEDDIEVIYSGVRPGEKLFEELTLDEELAKDTQHEKIFVGDTSDADANRLHEHLDVLFAAASKFDDNQVRRVLKKIVPSFTQGAADNVVPIDSARNSETA